MSNSASLAMLPGRQRWPNFWPLVVFVPIMIVFRIGLWLDPQQVPSPLIGKPVPEFRLAPMQGRALGLASGDLRGEVSVVNVFASWCTACREEHPYWMRLSREGALPIHGLDDKDRPQDAARWLDSLGDPYTRTGADLDGRVAIDWDLYGVPETFVVDRRGLIRDKIIGPIDAKIVDQRLMPLVRRLREE